jgi:histidinol-phosphate aminotransferase
MNLENLIRQNIKALKPYATARDEFKGQAEIYLDANENPYGSALPHNFNRYPDPLQKSLKSKISEIKGIKPEHIFLGNGSDEAIDVLMRIFCEPKQDNIIILPPTYGMYEVSANINDVEIRKVNLTADFQLDVEAILNNIDEHTKLIFICSPNNPTGNAINREDIELILNNFAGIVVIDEAYVNYSKHKTFVQDLGEYQNLVVMQTFSKAWGLAGLRLGLAFASLEMIDWMNKVKAPYNINQATQDLAMEALENLPQINAWIQESVAERTKLSQALLNINFVEKVYPSEANFILAKMKNAKQIYDQLIELKTIVRDRSKVVLCDDCLRISVGTPAENEKLIAHLQTLA